MALRGITRGALIAAVTCSALTMPAAGTTAAGPAAGLSAGPATWVEPIRWDRFDRGLPAGPGAELSRDVLLNATKYALVTWFPARYGGQTGRYLDLGGDVEGNIRPPASAAMALATVLATGAYDAGRTGVPVERASQVAVRLLTSIAHRHKANRFDGGWGDHWQSAFWAADTATAGWLLADQLGADDRLLVERMVTYEADRFLDYQVPYYQRPDGTVVTPGDSKAEENAWNATLLNLASAMLPRHPDQPTWQRKAVELMVSAYSRPSDLRNRTVVNGRPVADWLHGSNIFEDGTLVNHSRIHPDYMTSITQMTSAPLVYSLAGRPTPRAALFNAELVYAALVDLDFASPPYQQPGGTIYRRDAAGRATSELYYPQGNDWGTGRRMHVGLIDTEAHLFGFDRRVSVPAADWAAAHIGQVHQMQSRFADGRTYGAPGEDTYSGREQWVAQIAARAYLANWVSHQGAVEFTNAGYPAFAPGISLRTEVPDVFTAGQPAEVTVEVRNTGHLPLVTPEVELTGPDGWTATAAAPLPRVIGPGDTAVSRWTVTPPAGASGGTELRTTLYHHQSGWRLSFADTPVALAPAPPAGAVWLSDLEWIQARAAYPPRRDVNNYSEPLAINGVEYAKGLWLDDGFITYHLGGNCTEFTADLGIDDAIERRFGPELGSVTYQVWTDDVQRYDSGLVTGASATVPLRVDVGGAELLRIVVTDGGDGRRYDWADWGSARLACQD